MKRLGVNIDHVATLRNARGENHPSPFKAAHYVKKLPESLKSIPISTPGSRFIK